ncbi:MAG: hypothetical protein HPY45_03135 [Anaerolineae bacterium]|nr:hypothetical protein [Anaerolineae bacterium]
MGDIYPQKPSSLCLNELFLPLEKLYSEQVVAGIAFRAGKIFFEDLIRKKGKQMGLLRLEYRTLPTSQRIYNGLLILANNIGNLLSIDIETSKNEEGWYWHTLLPRDDTSRTQFYPPCFFLAGLIKAYISWATGEKTHIITNSTTIMNTSLSCKIEVMKP